MTWALLSSCVSNKKFLYLQKGDVNKSDLPKDSVVRSYQQRPYEYKIQPEDILSVRFESLTPKDLDFFNSLAQNQQQMVGAQIAGAQLIGELVDREGQIPFPFIGKVKVAGFTVFEIQDKLQKIAEQYLNAPVVKVRLINFRFTVLGEVAREGTVVLNNNRVNVLEAIGSAGGLGELADRANVKLIRTEGGQTTVQYLNFLDENLIHSPYFYVHQNDVLVVPALRQRSYRKYFGQNLAIVLSSVSIFLVILSLRK